MVNKEPFSAVVQRHTPLVLRVCRAVVGPVDADDACQETLLAALRAWPDLPNDANVEAWLVTIAHRKGIDILRGRARRAVPLAAIPDQVRPAATVDSDGRLTQALELLSERQRMAVAYHHLGGLPHIEVAELIGGSDAAARKAASDGIRRLRELLGATEDGDLQ